MKNSIHLFFISLIMISCSSEPHYIVKGKIKGSDSIKFYLQKREDGRTITIDSAVSKKGIFIFKGGAVGYPQLIQLVAGTSRKRTSFFLENSEITITGILDSLFKVEIKGSKTEDEYKSFLESIKPLSEKYSSNYNAYQAVRNAGNDSRIEELEKQADSIRAELLSLQKNYVKNNPASYISPTILGSLSADMGAEELESMINKLDTAIASTPQIKSLKNKLLAMKTVAVGRKAPDFTMNDTEGIPVALSSKLGSKLLLVDFWASWCGPCRQENPNIVKVFIEFHKKGFDVFGVSLDRKREDWIKAIADDKLEWTHVSDLQFWNNSAARMYAVYSIPSNFLLDESGTIIGRNLTGENLYNKVNEALETIK